MESAPIAYSASSMHTPPLPSTFLKELLRKIYKLWKLRMKKFVHFVCFFGGIPLSASKSTAKNGCLRLLAPWKFMEFTLQPDVILCSPENISETC